MTPTSWPAAFGLDGAGVGNAGLFDDGERVEVGADEQRGAGAVLEDGDDSIGLAAVGIFADVFGDGVAGFAELRGEQGGGVFLEVRELGVGVDVLIDVDEVCVGRWRLRVDRRCDERGKQQKRESKRGLQMFSW